MMDKVIQEHLPVGEKTRSAKDRLALKTEPPTLGPGFVRSALERGANFCCTFVEGLHELLGGFEWRPGSRRPTAEIQLRSRQYGDAKSSQFCNVRSQLAQRHGFGMRLKIRQDWNALQNGARLFDFIVEFGE